jgi:hypothetical protein
MTTVATTIPTTVPPTNVPVDQERYNYVSAGATFLVIGVFIFAVTTRTLSVIAKKYIWINFFFWVGLIFMIIGVALLSKKA